MESFHQENDDDNSMLHEENKNDNKKKNLGVTPIIISPKRSKESIMTIRAHKVHQEADSITSKIGHLFGSFKEKTTDYVEKVQTKHQDINSFATTKVQAGTNIKKEKEGGEQQFVIPIIEERYNLSKKTLVEDVKIEKKWVIHDEKIHVPIAYEKIFVDDKELDSYSKEDIFSQIKDKIINFQYLGENDDDKNKIIEDKKVHVDIAKERVTIEYPNGKKERLTEK
jgi:stress response protein YsnF